MKIWACWADKSVKNWRNLPISNPKPDLHKINAHTKFCENPLMFTQAIIRKQKTDRQMYDWWTDGQTDRLTDTWTSNVKPQYPALSCGGIKREITFLTSLLTFQYTNSFLKGVYSKRQEFDPNGSIFFSFYSGPVSEGSQKQFWLSFDRVVSHESKSIPLKSWKKYG